jgi:hypothetical protein
MTDHMMLRLHSPLERGSKPGREFKPKFRFRGSRRVDHLCWDLSAPFMDAD